MRESGLSWICETLNVKLRASRVLRLLWVDGYSTQAVAVEMGMSRPAVAMCSGRHLRKAELRARAAQEAETQVLELQVAVKNLQRKESKGEADDLDRYQVARLEEACTVDVRLLAMEAILWRQHLLDDAPVDHEADPDALPPPLGLDKHARELLRSMKGPRKKTPQTPEYDANGRRVGAPAVLVSGYEAEQLCRQVSARHGITFEIANPPL